MVILEQLAGRLRHRIQDFEEAGMGYWRIKAALADGRVFSNVYVTDQHVLGFPDKTPFRITDIIDIAWDGYRGSESSAVPVEVVSKTPISPWTNIAALPSPDGSKRATIFGGIEISMAGPTVCTVTINAGGTAWQVDSINPSMVWSDDSRRLAIPFWKGRTQHLMILDTDTQTTSVGKTEYRILQIDRFARGVVSGLDSPIHQPMPFDVPV